jgi:hypothetical protein
VKVLDARCCVVGAPVVPHGKITLGPLVSHLEVVVLGDMTEEILNTKKSATWKAEEREKVERYLEDIVTLVLGQLVDARGKEFVDIEAFPASDGVDADDWMDSSERVADVLGRSSRTEAEREAVSSGRLSERRSVVCGGEGLEKASEGRAEGVVCAVGRRPECVAARLGERRQPQGRIVGRHRLKGDVRVPAGRRALGAFVSKRNLATSALVRRDLPDIVAVFAELFGQRMDVQGADKTEVRNREGTTRKRTTDDVDGFPLARPSRSMNSVCSDAERSCFLKKTTPLWETDDQSS